MALVLLLTACLASAAEPVRLAVAFNPLQPILHISAQNVDQKPLLLTFGSLIGPGYYDFRFRLIVTTPQGHDLRVIYTGVPAAIGGRIDPLVVPLLPGAIYDVAVPLSLFYVLDANASLAEYVRKAGRLHVELNVEHAACPLYGYPNPNMILCWQGHVVSNALQMPLAPPATRLQSN